MIRYLCVSFGFLFGAIATLIGVGMLAGSFFAAQDAMQLEANGDMPWWLLPTLFGALGTLLAPLGIFLILRSLRRTRETLELLRSGLLAEGTVTCVAVNRSLQINGRNPLFLDYEYQGPDGRRYQGRSPLLPRKLESEWQAGSTIRVVYDPTNPRRSEADIFRLRAAGCAAR